jgi:thiamine pyrophosphokinase
VLRSSSAVTLVGGAGCRAEDLAAALRVAPRIVAVDSGAAAVLGAGLQPELVVGDMDSLDPALRRQLGARVREIGEQETTDFDKALRAVEAPLIVGVGFLGARLDHELAAMTVLARSSRRCVLVAPHDVVFAARGDVSLDLAPGTRVSLFPMAAVTGWSEGLVWPIEGLEFRPDGRIGTSNEATGPVRMRLDGPGMLVILPRDALGAVLAALR